MGKLSVNSGITGEGRNGSFEVREVSVTVFPESKHFPETAIVGIRSRRSGASSPSRIQGDYVRVISLLKKIVTELEIEQRKLHNGSGEVKR